MFGNGGAIGLLDRSVQYVLETENILISCVELAKNEFHYLVDKRKKELLKQHL